MTNRSVLTRLSGLRLPGPLYLSSLDSARGNSAFPRGDVDMFLPQASHLQRAKDKPVRGTAALNCRSVTVEK